ncbi:MAG: hypothetical protein EOP43_01410 [Sphingobacteriaceae bacterium]|nr:MAG: hypothetical protein EOP43_01410 [Sphingobacteriaceae bacterium]
MGRKILLEHINVPNINTFDVYRSKGGYAAVEKALKTLTPEEIVEEVKKSGLRGRGGAGFPTGMKWSFLAKPEGVPRYLVCNADESEPGTFKDRFLMTKTPHLLIEGMIIGSFALGAKTSYIYVRGEMMRCPTVVNNVESIAAVVPIIRDGGEEYAKIGIGRSTGTKLISASGNLVKPGIYEIDLGLPVEEFIYSDEYCGGIANGKRLKAVVAGGSSVPILPANLITKTINQEARLMSYESLSDGGFATGSMMGSGGFIAFDEDQCIVRNTWNFARFYHHESCGQCSPCREGTGWMEKVLHRLEYGHGKLSDLDLLVDVSKKIEGNTICPLGDAAAWPVASAIRHFRDEFEWHVTEPRVSLERNYGLANYADPLPKPEPVAI